MTWTDAQSPHAREALGLVETLQKRFVDQLDALQRLEPGRGTPQGFEQVAWLRDAGRHGGGTRYEIGDTPLYDRASVNVSQVHYDDEAARKLGSATALSAIVHPRNPHASSVHIHISWTEMRNGTSYWRLMADLNPSIENLEATEAFEAALKAAAPEQYERASEEGDRYFFIPALDRHRGVTHFYLENYASEDPAADARLARTLGATAIDSYLSILKAAVDRTATDEDRAIQLSYHTLYLFQVLTLDRGTSAGLLVHNQNDIGILGSLPSHVDRELLASWGAGLIAPQEELLGHIVNALPAVDPAPVTTEAKRALAEVLRNHYRKHPDALKLQAAGNICPPTVENHS